MTSALQTSAVDPSVGAAITLYDQLRGEIRNVLAPDLSDAELQLFAMVAYRSRLDPFSKQIYAIKRGGRLTFQTGIDGFRSSAEDTGEYDGQDDPEYGPDVSGHPEWARVTIHRIRDGRRISQSATAWWAEMYPGDQLGAQWRKMPRVMLAKCAEAMAFRKLFPKRFADVYEQSEMAQAERPEAAPAPTARERIAARRAEAEGTTAPAPEPVVVEGEVVSADGEVATPTWTYQEFNRAAIRASKTKAAIYSAAEAIWPDRELALVEIKAWGLEGAEWYALALRLELAGTAA